jgi:hypothetical protein
MSSGKIICTKPVFRGIFLLLFLTGRTVFAQGYYDEKVTSVSNVSTTVSNLGLIGKIETESQLAFIICHEIGHDLLGHVVKGIIKRLDIVQNPEFNARLKKVLQQENENN